MAEIVYEDVTLASNDSVVSGLSFHIEEASHACIHGPVGSGKSFLLRSLAGKLHIKTGLVQFSDEGKHLSEYEFFQQAHLIEFTKPSRYFNPSHHFYQQRYHHQMEDDIFSKSMTISALLELKGFSNTNKNLQKSLHRAGLSDHLDTKLIQLSNGQRKKLQLLVALLEKSKLLLLDAPHLGLDIESRADLNQWLWEVARHNDLQIIMITDERDIPDWISCRIKLTSGRSSLNNSNISLFSDRVIQTQKKKGSNSVPASIIEVENLTMSLGGIKLFKDINWQVQQGERLALIGKNGSGKSTMMSFLYADNPRVYSSKLRMHGVQRGKGDNIWEIKQRIGFVSSELHIYFTESISSKRVIATGFFDTKFLPRKLSSEENEIVDKFADYFGVKHLLNKNFQQISYGEQRLLLLIRALVKIPPILLLDEPYQGLDQELIRRSNTLINYLVEKYKITVIFISHYEDEIPECINRKLLLSEGELIEI